jgi:hypothetical protein
MLSPDGKPSPVRVTPFNELAPQFSPGPAGGPRWVAYASDESGRSEVYVQSYPGGEDRIPVSTGGGILMLRVTRRRSPLNVILNWHDELKPLVPAK